MRIFILVATALVGLAPTSFASPRTLLLPTVPLALQKLIQPGQLAAWEDGVAVVQVPEEAIDTWSQAVHEALGGCGGFLDLTHEVLDGVTPLTLALREVRQRSEFVHQNHADSFTFRGTATIAALVDAASPEDLWKHLADISAFPDRSATTENGGKAARWLAQRATELAGHLEGFHTWEIATDTPSYSKQPSIVATLPGRDPSLGAVVIGAHLDTFSPGRPGADDDGSGSAVLLETLRVVGAEKAQFKRTVHVIWYAAEERGLVGSSFVVKRFQKDARKVHAALQFDMTGFNSEEEDADVYMITDNTDDDLTRLVGQIANQYAGAVVSETACGYQCSDHANWTRAGVPAAFPFEASFDNMNRRLHTADDTMSILDSKHAVRFAKIALGYLGEVAELE